MRHTTPNAWWLAAVIAVAPALTAARPGPQQPSGHLRAIGARLVRADGTAFAWRGITAFRLLEHLAAGREGEVVAYLDWAAAERLTVVRVLTMASHLFTLAPEDGVARLDRLLDLAAARGLFVEVIALADTASADVDLARHVAAVGAVCARHPNALLELANEPDHPTQHPDLARPETLAALRGLVPPEVPVAVGAVEDPVVLGAGDYVTLHVDRGRSDDPWAHVWAVVEAYDRVDPLDLPVINDEPIGAGESRVPGHRDTDPSRFRAVALLSRFLGMGATFHYESGLNGRIPQGVEAACLAGWLDAWRVLPEDFEARARFRGSPGPDGPLAGLEAGPAARLFEVEAGSARWVLGLAVTDDVRPVVREGWRVAGIWQWPGVWLAQFAESSSGPEFFVEPAA